MRNDRQGNPVTGAPESVAVLDGMIRDYYAWTGDILGALAAAVRDDPAFLIGHTALATIFVLGGMRGDAPAVRAEIAAAEGAVAGATGRERSHLAVAQALAAGELARAAALAEAIVDGHPMDALALRYATDLYYYLGDSAGIRDVTAKALARWDAADPLRAFVLGRHAFGLEESGELDRAEVVAARALALEPRDAWATHALAHVHETRGAAEEGARFLETTHGDWRHGEWLTVHLGWHLALFLIELERGDEVPARYDRFVAPRLKVNFILDLIDAASLLWRLELAGVDVGARWREVAAVAAARIGEHVLAFNDLHVALALAGAHDAAAIARLIESIGRYRREGAGDNRAITDTVGAPLVEAVAAFAAGDWTRTVAILAPLRNQVVRIGGSHAQRDVVEETLAAAAIRAQDWPLAKSLLAERLARRPTPRARRRYAEISARG